MADQEEGTTPWSGFLTETQQRLTDAGIDGNARLEARWMIEEVTGSQGAEYYDVLDQPATVRGVDKLDAMVARRSQGEPIQYVLGHWSFRELDLLVDKRVLIPRPETEVVVGVALGELDRMRAGNQGGSVIDLGTGSGAVGLSIAIERAGTRVLLTDTSDDVLDVTRANLAGLGIRGASVEISRGSWFEAVPDRFLGECDVLVSNPPYIASSEQLDDSVELWEPSLALRSGIDGMDDLRVIVAGASDYLRPGGSLVLEMGHTQTLDVMNLAADAGFQTESFTDLAGMPRGVVCRW